MPMNSPSPLVPQGSSLEQQHQARSTLKVRIFCALGVNVGILLLLLMQGCKREQVQTAPELAPVFTDTNPPPLDVASTNVVPEPAANPNPPPYLPPPVVETAALPPAAASEYTILKGDTFSTIAPKFGVTVKALQAANPTVDPAKLQIGKKIVIPAPAAPTPTAGATGVAATVGDNGGLYKVKSGDTLSKIATEHHTTVKAIQSANNLTDSRIKVGQLLKLPAKTAPTDAVPLAPAR
jgi:LysM repeat protein